MKKDFLQLMYNSETNMEYVKKVKDELTKNHKESNRKIYTGFMPQIMDETGRPHHLCSVRSYKNYINSLNPKIEFLANSTEKAP